jgi:hypothetical protein
VRPAATSEHPQVFEPLDWFPMKREAYGAETERSLASDARFHHRGYYLSRKQANNACVPLRPEAGPAPLDSRHRRASDLRDRSPGPRAVTDDAIAESRASAEAILRQALDQLPDDLPVTPWLPTSRSDPD